MMMIDDDEGRPVDTVDRRTSRVRQVRDRARFPRTWSRPEAARRGAAVVGAGLLLCAGCRAAPPVEDAPEACHEIATGASSDASYVFGSALAQLMNEGRFDVCLTAVQTDGSTFNVGAVEAGDADFAIARADTVYTAYVDGTPLRQEHHTRLRGMAVLYRSALQIVVRSDSPVRTWRDLRDEPIGVSIFSSTDHSPIVGYTALVQAAGDLGPGRIHNVRMRLGELVHALPERRVAGGLILTAYPVPLLREMSTGKGFRLLDVQPEAAVRIRARYPFFKPTVIPAGTYPDQLQAVKTIAVENLLVTREDLDDESVYLVTKTLLEHLADIATDHEAALQVNPDLASAVPIPLHPGAARYYRERELLR